MSLEYKFENRGTVQVRPIGSDKRSPCWYILATLLILMLAVGVGLFLSGYLTPISSSGAHAITFRGKIDEQERLITQQAASIKQMEEQMAAIKREKQVQDAANAELNKKLAATSADLATEREKLVLYDGILSPDGLEGGLHIQHFGIKPRLVDQDGKKAESLYQYHLVLANIKAGDVSLEGDFTITISGKQDGKTVTVTQTDVTPTREKALTHFAVKHYQSLEGNFLFPGNFTPESVKLKVSPAVGDAPERLTKSYDWATFNDSNASTNKE